MLRAIFAIICSLLLFKFEGDDIQPQSRNHDREEIDDIIQAYLSADKVLIMFVEIERTNNPDEDVVRNVFRRCYQKVQIQVAEAPQNEDAYDIGNNGIAVESRNGAAKSRKSADYQYADQIGRKNVEVVERRQKRC